MFDVEFRGSQRFDEVGHVLQRQYQKSVRVNIYRSSVQILDNKVI